MDDIYLKCIEKWGLEGQLIITIEELSELIKAITKFMRIREIDDNIFRNVKIKNEKLHDIAEEIADVEIVIEQMKQHFKIADLVINEKKRKLERLLKILNSD